MLYLHDIGPALWRNSRSCPWFGVPDYGVVRPSSPSSPVAWRTAGRAAMRWWNACSAGQVVKSKRTTDAQLVIVKK